MSFNSTDKSGIVEVLPVTDFLQFLPSFGAASVLSFQQIAKLFPSAFKTAAELTAKRTTTTGAVSFSKNTPLGKNWYDIFKPAIVQSPKLAIPTGIKTGAGSIAKKFGTQAVIGSGFVFGSTALLTLTGGGQNLVSTTGQGIKDFSNLGQSVNKLFQSNPLIPIGLLILGGLVIVTVIKK